MSKVLKDVSGFYNLDNVGSIHPVPIKGDRNDQTKVTAVTTSICTIGGQTHQTNIPWAIAASVAEAHWNAGQAPASGPVPGTLAAPVVPVAVDPAAAPDLSQYT